MRERRTHPITRGLWRFMPWLVLAGFLLDVGLFYYFRAETAQSSCYAQVFNYAVSHKPSPTEHAYLVSQAKACAAL